MAKNKTTELKEMQKEKNMDQDRQDLHDLVDQRVLEMLECKPEKMDKDIFYMKLSQTKLGMTYIRDRDIMKRVNSGQMIRIVNLIASDPKERANYIKASMPEITLQLEG